MKGLLIILIMLLAGCSSNREDSVQADDNVIHIQTIPAPDGAMCYVILQGQTAVGGNCLFK